MSKIDDTMWNTLWTTVAIWDGLEVPQKQYVDIENNVYMGTCGGYYHFKWSDLKQFDKIHGTQYVQWFTEANDNDCVNS